VLILLRLNLKINLLREDFELNRRTSKLNMLILDKTFRIIYIHYLSTLCELLKKITNLAILKKDLYKREKKILNSR